MTKRGKAEKWAARSERLSAALRENLKRRKQQAKEREMQRDLQRDLARHRAQGPEAPATDADIKAPAPDFRRNRGPD
jgi:hypothetical protein